MADGLLSMGYAIGAPAAAMRRAPAAFMAIVAVVAMLLVLGGGRAAADDVSPVGRWFVLELRGSAFSRPAAAGRPMAVATTGRGDCPRQHRAHR